MAWSLFFSFLYFQIFVNEDLLVLYEGETKMLLILLFFKEAFMGKIYTQSSQKASWECTLSYNTNSDINVAWNTGFRK